MYKKALEWLISSPLKKKFGNQGNQLRFLNHTFNSTPSKFLLRHYPGFKGDFRAVQKKWSIVDEASSPYTALVITF